MIFGNAVEELSFGNCRGIRIAEFGNKGQTYTLLEPKGYLRNIKSDIVAFPTVGMMLRDDWELIDIGKSEILQKMGEMV